MSLLPLMETIVITMNHCSSTVVAYHYSVTRLGLLPTGIGAFLKALVCEEVLERLRSTTELEAGPTRLLVDGGTLLLTLPIKDSKASGAVDRRQRPTGAPQLVRDHPGLHLQDRVGNKLPISNSRPSNNRKGLGTPRRMLRAIPVKHLGLRHHKACGLRLVAFCQLELILSHHN